MAHHLLTDKNFEDRTAVCSVDGPVPIRRVGEGNWICEVKKRESSAAWRKANPERVRTGRHASSPHHLIVQDLDTMTGTCPIDGKVDLVARGRGFMCSVRAAEMGVSSSALAERCRVCNFWTSLERPVVDGICTVCLGTDETAPARTQMLSSADRRDVGLVGVESGDAEDDDGADMGLGGGWHGLDLAGFDAYADEGWDYEDPSLKTLGPPLAPDDPWTRVMKEERRRARLARERRRA